MYETSQAVKSFMQIIIMQKETKVNPATAVSPVSICGRYGQAGSAEPAEPAGGLGLQALCELESQE